MIKDFTRKTPFADRKLREVRKKKNAPKTTLQSLPYELHLEILEHLPANPFTLADLGSVGRSPLAVAAKDDRLWKQISPESARTQNGGLKQAFHERMAALSRPHRNLLRKLWADPSTAQFSLQFDEEARAQWDLVLATVTHDGLQLELALPELRAEPKIASAAVQQNGLALAFVASALQDDPKIVRLAVAQNPASFAFASGRLKSDASFVRALIGVAPDAYKHASPQLRSSSSLALAAVLKKGSLLAFASEALKDNRGLVLAAMQSDPQALRFASSALKADPVLRALAAWG